MAWNPNRPIEPPHVDRRTRNETVKVRPNPPILPPPAPRAEGGAEPTHGHRWRFDGDDPYVVCDCGEVRDSISNRLIRPAPSGDEVAPTAVQLRFHDRPKDGVQCGYATLDGEWCNKCGWTGAPAPVSGKGPKAWPDEAWLSGEERDLLAEVKGASLGDERAWQIMVLLDTVAGLRKGFAAVGGRFDVPATRATPEPSVGAGEGPTDG